MVGILIHYSLMFILATICFWTVRAQGIVWGYYNLFNIARMPDEAFRGAFKAVFTFALPVLLVSNVPVRVLADKIAEPQSWLLLIGIGAAWAAVSEVFLARFPCGATPARVRKWSRAAFGRKMGPERSGYIFVPPFFCPVGGPQKKICRAENFSRKSVNS